ncbi:MAG: zinc ABC transporter substrate-binding protein [Clostridia bacterium]|nr:zinc ABC transporter substrate-binding protein [Clostridia bacterium]
MKKIFICLLCVVMLCGCCKISPQNHNEKLTIVTTIFPLYDFARQICGDKAEIKMLIKPGSEMHSYDPLPSDMASIYNSDLFLYIGGESDNWVENLLDDNDVNALALIDCIGHDAQHHHGHDHADEHIWTSPENAVLMIKKIYEDIIKVDDKNEDYYKKNCDEYIKKINTASQKIESTVSEYKNPFILVADRFPFVYLTKHYGIDYEAAFDGCAVSTDISMKTMSRLTKTIKSKGVKTVFVTELSNKNIANALKEELGVEIVELHSAHNVSRDDFNGGISYVDIMYRNGKALERGLQ